MSENLSADLRTYFGFEAFRPGQAEAIQSLLAGEHTLVVMPTGAGKSLIYQFTALQRPGISLVISPLISLMQDQVDSLKRRRIPATFINSAVSAAEQMRRLEALAEGQYRVVYVAPERLRSTPFQHAIPHVTIGLLAVDEAHCIAQWGHDFRPDYLHIAAARHEMKNPVTAALTATATPKVQDDIVKLLGLPSAERIITGFNRPNLSFEVCYTADLETKFRALGDLLAGLPDGGAIVYVGTRRDAEEVADFVREVAGTDAQHYHGGLESETRTRVQDTFIAGDLPVVVATNAFGMGIDRPDVRLVAHFYLPGTLEAYYQEAGRAGRDGKPAQAVLLYAPKDRALQEWFIENDTPALDEMRAFYEVLQAWDSPQGWTTIEDLSLAMGLNEVRVKVGLSQLEAAGAIHRLGDAGPRMLLRIGDWDHAGIRATVVGVEDRLRYRETQLDQVVAYAESNACRRRILLDHFGDRSSAEAPVCCDNCLSRQRVAPSQPGDISRMSESELAALFILDALRRMKWEVGRKKLAQVLKGSKAKDILKFDYNKNRHYGRLAVFSLDEIKGLIDQLASQGYLKLIGGDLPVLRLTPQGEAAVQSRSVIPLRLPKQPRGDVTVGRQRRRFGSGARGRFEPETPPASQTERVVELGRMGAPAGVPELIAALDDPNGNVRRLAASALGKIRDPRAVEPLIHLLQRETLPQVRQYAVRALAVIGDPHAQSLLQVMAADSAGRDYTRVAAQSALKRLGGKRRSIGSADVAAFLNRSHPKPLSGPWQVGWALGFHSSFAGADWSRSTVGDLAFRLKYRGDLSALQPLAQEILALCDEDPELKDVDALVPVPPSTARPFDPVRILAEALARALQKPLEVVLVKTRPTAPQKEMRTLAQKRTNVAGAFAVQLDVRDKRLLLIDDLYDSGATLEEATRVLLRAGAARICVLTMTRTIHSDA